MMISIIAAPVVFAVDPLPVHGGPTFSSSAGGFLAFDPTAQKYGPIFVNNAGTAVASVWKFNSAGAQIDHQAVRWNASTGPTELPNVLGAGGINDAGTVIPADVPGRFTATATELTFLDVFPLAYVISAPSRGTDINNSDTVVGALPRTARDEFNSPVNLGFRAVRWDGSGTAVTELGHLGVHDGRNGVDAVGYTGVGAFAINDAGVAVGSAQKYDPIIGYQGSHAVKWDPSGVEATLLGNLGTAAGLPGTGKPEGYNESVAFAINSSGTAVGFSHVYDQSGMEVRSMAPVRWDPSGNPTALENGLGLISSYITGSTAALNDAGTAVGAGYKWREETSTILGTRAIRWDHNTTVATELGNLGTNLGIAYSEALAINDAGTAVGFARTPDQIYRAVYWGANDTLAIDLNTLIDPDSGWVLNRAVDVSDTGWIAGVGTFDPDGPGGQIGYARHFLIHVPATVPEPGAGVVTILAVCAGITRMRRRRSGPPSGKPSRLESLEHRLLLSFADATVYAEGTRAADTAAADFNGDGRVDLAMADLASNTFRVLLGNGDGTFQPPRSSPAGPDFTGPRSVTAGDFNDGGRVDLVTLLGSESASDTLGLAIGNGDGTFRPAQLVGLPPPTAIPAGAVGPFGQRPISIAAGDMNGDSWLDLLAIGWATFKIPTGDYEEPYWYVVNAYANVLLGDGHGAFAQATVLHLQDRFNGPLAVEDFTSDGEPDLLIVQSSSLSVLPGDGQGGMGAPITSVPPTAGGYIPAPGDFDQDGRLDVLLAGGGGNLHLMTGGGDGRFATTTLQVAGSPAGGTVSDVNLDGRLDIVTLRSVVQYEYIDGEGYGHNPTSTHSVAVLLGRKDGSFVASGPARVLGTWPAEFRVGPVLLQDVDGDDYPDLIAFDSINGQGLAVSLNDGNWTGESAITGDADFDGRITSADYFRIDRGRALGHTGWTNGDFDASGGRADADDYMLIDRSFLTQAGVAGSAPQPPSQGIIPQGPLDESTSPVWAGAAPAVLS
jgi:hypothetical protein